MKDLKQYPTDIKYIITRHYNVTPASIEDGNTSFDVFANHLDDEIAYNRISIHTPLRLYHKDANQTLVLDQKTDFSLELTEEQKEELIDKKPRDYPALCHELLLVHQALIQGVLFAYSETQSAYIPFTTMSWGNMSSIKPSDK